MKKQLLTLLIAISSTLLMAQPTVSSAVFGALGDVINYTEVVPDGLTAGPSGENVTWDFSDLTLTGAFYSLELINLADAPDYTEFPGANMASDNGFGQYGFLKLTSSEYTNYGSNAIGVITYYDDPEEIFVFPMSYGTTNTDNFHASFFSGIDFERSGTTISEADGYGTLILPTGTFEDVLRVKVSQDYTDDAALLPSPIIYDFTLYYWLKDGITGPLFQYFELNVGGAFPSESSSAAFNTDLSIGIKDNTTLNQISISPNPAIDIVKIDCGTDVYNKQLIVYNQLGQIVLTDVITTVNQSASIDVSELVTGIYQLVIQDGNNRITAKFVKQ